MANTTDEQGRRFITLTNESIAQLDDDASELIEQGWAPLGGARPYRTATSEEGHYRTDHHYWHLSLWLPDYEAALCERREFAAEQE